jgi:phage-related protein
VGEVAAAGDEIAKSSKQIGINAQRLQELRFAANLAGASNAELGTGLKLLAKNSLEAAQGTKSFVEDFARLGVRVTDSTGQLKDADQLLLEVSDGLRGLESDSERAALAQTLLGRSGIKLVPFMAQGSEAIEEQAARASELGEVFDAKLLANSEALIDAQRELDGAFQGIKNTIAREFMPFAIRVVQWLTNMVVAIQGPVGRALSTLQTVFVGIGKALSVIATLIGDVLDGLGSLGTAIKVLAAVSVTAWAVSTAPIIFMIAVLGLLGVAIVAIIEDLEAMGSGGESVIGGLIGEFQLLLEETGSIFDAITGVIATAIDFWADKLFGFTTDAKAELSGLLDFASSEFSKLGAQLSAAGGFGGEVAAAATPVAGLVGGAVNVINQIETTVNAAPGMDAERLAGETAARTGSGTDRLMRRTAAQLSVGGR